MSTSINTKITGGKLIQEYSVYLLKDLIRSLFIVPQIVDVEGRIIVFDNSQAEMNQEKEVRTSYYVQKQITKTSLNTAL